MSRRYRDKVQAAFFLGEPMDVEPPQRRRLPAVHAAPPNAPGPVPWLRSPRGPGRTVPPRGGRSRGR